MLIDLEIYVLFFSKKEKNLSTGIKSSLLSLKNIHRDLAYFFVGIIIIFSVSGIALNHRESFDLQKYVVKTENISADIKKFNGNFDENNFKEIAEQISSDKFYAGRENKTELTLYFKDAHATIDKITGKGEIEYVKTIPVLGHMTILHKNTNIWWIWFSDLFGIALIIISVSGLLLLKGKNSFKKRGWKLALAGLIFPLIFLMI